MVSRDLATIDALIPGMAAENPPDRREPQAELERLCTRAARPGAEVERRAISLALTERLGPSVPTEARVWMIRQLERIGADECVSRLALLLIDANPRVRESARRALQRNPSQRAGEKLRDELEYAKDSAWRVALINALAARRDTDAADMLVNYANADDPATAAAAIAALGTLGGQRAAQSLTTVWRGADATRREAAAATLIRVADDLLNRDQAAQAAGIYHDIYLSSAARSTRRAALRGWALADANEALPRLLEIVRGDVDPEYRTIAARLAQMIPGDEVSDALAAELRRSGGEFQILLIDVLAHRASPSARSAIHDALDSSDVAVRIAALQAISGFGRETDLVALATVAGNTEGRERDAARRALADVPGAGIDDLMIRLCDAEAEPANRGELIRALAARRATQALPTIYAAAADEEAVVRVASLEALGKLAPGEDLARVVALLTAAADEETREAAVDCVVNVAKRVEVDSRRVEPLNAALRNAETGGNSLQSVALVRALGRIGGAHALSTIREALQMENAEVVDAAVRALADWPDPQVMDDLHAIAAGSDNQTHRVLALRGFVNLARKPSERGLADTLALLDGAMKLAERDEERKLVLAAVAEIPHPDALAFACKQFENEALRSEAGAAIADLAIPVSAVDRDDATKAIQTVLAADVADATKKRAQHALDSIRRFSGYGMTWLVSGPYARKDVEASDLLKTPFAPESGSSDVAWRPLSTTNATSPWIFDLSKAIGGNNCCAYVRTRVFSGSDQPARLEIGSDDSVQVWLNERIVHSNNSFRGITLAQDKVDVHLQQGWNTLMLKISQGGGGWGFCCGVTGPNGEQLPDIRFEAK